jgi:ribonuclease R
MDELASILKARRDKRGGLDFDLDQACIILDKDGRAEYVGPAERRTANRIIEEFMLAANETVAERYFHMNPPFIYRVHEKQDPEKMEEFEAFVASFGLKTKDGYENIVNMMLLRAMKKAFYSESCGGHFGLGLKYYCHFTAPIRRYPDLMIHRIIKETLSGRPGAVRMKQLKEKTTYAAEISSQAERKALELERDAEKMKKAEYMSRHIGEVFDGIVSGVTPYGVYVQLPNTIEGMIRVYGRTGGFAPGDKLKVIVMSADVRERNIDFAVYGY